MAVSSGVVGVLPHGLLDLFLVGVHAGVVVLPGAAVFACAVILAGIVVRARRGALLVHLAVEILQDVLIVAVDLVVRGPHLDQRGVGISRRDRSARDGDLRGDRGQQRLGGHDSHLFTFVRIAPHRGVRPPAGPVTATAHGR